MSENRNWIKRCYDSGMGVYDEFRRKEQKRVERDQEFLAKLDRSIQEVDARQQQLTKSIDELDGFHDVTKMMTRTREEITELSELRHKKLEEMKDGHDRIEQGLDKADAMLCQRPTPPPIPSKYLCIMFFCEYNYHLFLTSIFCTCLLPR